jgi:hypothetical protein
MRKLIFVLSFVVLAAFVSPFIKTKSQDASVARSAQIKAIQLFGEKSGVALTRDAVWRTDNNGESWYEVRLPKSVSQSISDASFSNENQGWAILADEKNATLALAKTDDGGKNWISQPINLKPEDLVEANLNDVSLRLSDENISGIELRLASSSNFKRTVSYGTKNGGQTWEEIRREMVKGEPDEESKTLKDYFKFTLDSSSKTESVGEFPSESVIQKFPVNSHGEGEARSIWYLTQSGSCEGFKTSCVQTTKIYLDTSVVVENGKALFSVKEITPPAVTELNRLEKERARTEQAQRIAAQPPGGETRISLNRGFDKCTAATVAQMQTWWNESPFYDANIYISGRNRGCAQPQLTAAWVNQVSGMGWGLIPTIVGYQAPCVASTSNLAKHSSDPAVAEQQGRGEADIAISDANNLGLTQGTILYYDMERYDETASTPGCRTSVNAFLKGWTDRLHEQGYISGTYGSPTNAQQDWVNIPTASRMDAVWFARWDNIPSVWQTAPAVVPTNVWANHQRIKQYQAPHNETWGGVTFNIDGNIADGPVAKVRVARNKPADFDGDGKTDISVFRPSNGAWYSLDSSTNAFRAINFGASTDIITPGDFDNDGKTDAAVFRPENGTWYQYSFDPARPAAAVVRFRTFGAAGDIPVAADYDGDSITDLAVFRNGAWYITNSFDARNPNFRAESFGTGGDIPVPGDYDADGRADLAVFRPSNGTWYVQRSTAGFFAAQFGASGDKPVQGDYDGDGKTDLAVFRNGSWYLLRSTVGFAAVSFGVATDNAAPGDYDGDGKWDVGVFRSQTGTWYLLNSQTGFNAVNFGAMGDRPVPAGYIPQP